MQLVSYSTSKVRIFLRGLLHERLKHYLVSREIQHARSLLNPAHGQHGQAGSSLPNPRINNPRVIGTILLRILIIMPVTPCLDKHRGRRRGTRGVTGRSRRVNATTLSVRSVGVTNRHSLFTTGRHLRLIFNATGPAFYTSGHTL